MRRCVLAAAMALLSGCISLRLGAGVSRRGDSGERPATFVSEVGFIAPLPDPRWTISALAVQRVASSYQYQPVLGIEVGRFLGSEANRPESGDTAPPKITRQDWLLAGRVEAGHDDLGRYLGGAVVARTYFLSDASLSLVLNAGWYDGPVTGPAVGLGLLVGYW